MVLLFFSLGTPILADKPQLEKFYNDLWCDVRGGQQETTTELGTRIDCELDHHVVETDFDTKWAESIGQSLHFSAMTGKIPTILLVLQNHDGSDRSRYLKRLYKTIDAHNLPIQVYTVETKDYSLRK
jgi:hypothetical protein